MSFSAFTARPIVKPENLVFFFETGLATNIFLVKLLGLGSTLGCFLFLGLDGWANGWIGLVTVLVWLLRVF